MVIKMPLSDKGVADAIKQLKDAKSKIKTAQREIAERLGAYGAMRASLYFSVAQKNPDDIIPSISVSINRSTMVATIRAKSEDVGFIEFGAGSRYSGTSHPLNSEFGTGPGTFREGGTNWNNPKGWFYKRNGTKRHSFGQPAGMAMYKASLDLQAEAERIVKEVLSSL